jgi:site-specific recombinase XerD
MECAQESDHQTVNFITALGLLFHPVNPVHPVRFSVFQLHGYGLEHIDWRAGEVSVFGKGARLDRLPLPHDVGQAIANYLKTRRSVPSRRVFLCSKAPYEGLANHQVVSLVVRRALERAQLHPPHRGAHLLRHSLATSMLRRGATMAQIAQLLRHQRAETTEIYAKVDLNVLGALAQPWPGGAR